MKPRYGWICLQVTLEKCVFPSVDSWRSIDRKQSHLKFPVVLYTPPTHTHTTQAYMYTHVTEKDGGKKMER